MPLGHPSPGFDYVPEYQISALPWVTSSTVDGIKKFDFPKVTSFILFKNTSSGSMRFAFTEHGFDTGNYFELLSTEGISVDMRIKSFWVSGSDLQDFSLLVGLTVIPAHQMPTLTGTLPANSSSYSQWEGIG